MSCRIGPSYYVILCVTLRPYLHSTRIYRYETSGQVYRCRPGTKGSRDFRTAKKIIIKRGETGSSLLYCVCVIIYICIYDNVECDLRSFLAQRFRETTHKYEIIIIHVENSRGTSYTHVRKLLKFSHGVSVV